MADTQPPSSQETTISVGVYPIRITFPHPGQIGLESKNKLLMTVLAAEARERFPSQTRGLCGHASSSWRFDIETGVDINKKRERSREQGPPIPSITVADVRTFLADMHNKYPDAAAITHQVLEMGKKDLNQRAAQSPLNVRS